VLLVGVIHGSEPVKDLAADSGVEPGEAEVESLDGKAALLNARKAAVDRYTQAEEHKKTAEIELAQARTARRSATSTMDAATLRVKRAEEKAAVMAVESRSTAQQAAEAAAELAQLNALDQFKTSDTVASETMATTQRTIDQAAAVQTAANMKADKAEADAEQDIKAARRLAAEKVEAAKENSKLKVEVARTNAETLTRTAQNKAEASEDKAALQAQNELTEEEAEDAQLVDDTNQQLKSQEVIAAGRSKKQVQLAKEQEKAEAQKEVSEIHLLDAQQGKGSEKR